MAVATTAFTPLLTRFPYIAPIPPPDSWLTPIPRGEALFFLKNGQIAEPGAGDSQRFTITTALPPTFAYVLMEVTIMTSDLEDGDQADWDAGFRCYLQSIDGDPGGWLSPMLLDGGSIYHAEAAASARAGRTFQVLHISNKILIPGPAGGRLQIEGGNLNIDGGALNISFLIKFLEFDLNQAQLFAVNTPIPVR